MVKMKRVYRAVALIALLAIGAGLWVGLGGSVTGAQAQLPSIDGKIAPGEYKFSYSDPDLNVEVNWTIDDEFIYIGLKAPTTGWVGIGWRPGVPLEKEEEDKKGVDQYLGFVKGNALSLQDAFQDAPVGAPKVDTELGGQDNVLDRAGSEDSSSTTIEFKRKLNTQDKFDNPVPAQGEVYLAYGPNNADDFTTYHGPDKRKEVVVNFVTGKVEKED